MRISAIAVSVLFSFPLVSQEQQEGQGASPKDAFALFQSEAGGQWIAQWHPATGTPSAIYGTGLRLPDWRENSLEEARRHALRLLADRADLLGLGDSTFREIIGARMGRTWSFVFDQFYRGVPVIEGRADVRINMNGTVAMFGSRAFPIPAGFTTVPTISDDAATAIAWTESKQFPTGVKQPAPTAAPRLVIWGDIAARTLAPVSLAWEIGVSNVDTSGNGPIGRYFVDAHSGAVLHYESDKHECGIPGCTKAAHGLAAATPALDELVAAKDANAPIPVVTTVTVSAWTRTGNDAFSALVNTPLRGIVLNVPGIGTRTTDANGQFTIDITNPVDITVANLDGTHYGPIQGSDAPAGVFTVTPGVNTTIQLLTSGATVAQAAHTTTAYWVDRTNEWVRGILGNTAQMTTASAITPTVNIALTCNAYYSGNTINFYSAGGGCSNTAFSTVISHEWGHGLDERYGGISNVTGDGLSEGWGDIIGMYLVDSNLLGSGFQSAGVPLRNGINSRTYPQTGQTVHTAGQVWMGFAWELRSRLKLALPIQTAIDISNDIVIGSIVADATNQVDAVREVFIADDDDGNLLNGTPHYTQLSGAANAKLLPFPEQQFGSIAHVPLTTTMERLTPRMVNINAVPFSGSFNQVRLHYTSNGIGLVRNMQSTGLVFGYRALLPGLASGTVTYHIEAVHSTGTIVRFPATGEISYDVDPAPGQPLVVFHSEGFETGGAGWTSALVSGQNDWQVGDPAGKSGTSGGIAWADPANPATGTNCYGNDLGNTIGTTNWNGSYAPNAHNYLRSPIINCSGRVGVRLRFKRWLTIESGQFDQATLRCNGQLIWSNPVGTNTMDTSWQTVEYLLPMADNNPLVQLEWRLDVDNGVQFGGWNIDDIELGTKTAVPLDAELRLLPEQASQGTSITLTVTTQQGSWPWFLLFSDAPGPLSIPGFPTFQVGGAINLIAASTDAAGVSTLIFPASAVSVPEGVLLYSQVLTLDPTFTQWVVSNPFVNLFTQFP